MCDLELGFARSSPATPLVRCPLWLLWRSTVRQREFIATHTAPRAWPAKRVRACLVASSDFDGHRAALLEAFAAAGVHVDCPAAVGHNMDRAELDRDGKDRFVERYAFNVCPENSLGKGYVTEKVFEAVWAGCIPVYWGDVSSEEFRMLNMDRVILFDNSDPESCRRVAARLRRLLDDPRETRRMLELPIFSERALELFDAMDARVVLGLAAAS